MSQRQRQIGFTLGTLITGFAATWLGGFPGLLLAVGILLIVMNLPLCEGGK